MYSWTNIPSSRIYQLMTLLYLLILHHCLVLKHCHLIHLSPYILSLNIFLTFPQRTSLIIQGTHHILWCHLHLVSPL